MYVHNISVSIQILTIKLQTFASGYKPVKSNIPDKKYIVAAITKNTAGVRAALKIFLLSLCALN